MDSKSKAKVFLFPSRQLTQDRGTSYSETHQTPSEKEFTTDEEEENKLELVDGGTTKTEPIRTRDMIRISNLRRLFLRAFFFFFIHAAVLVPFIGVGLSSIFPNL